MLVVIDESGCTGFKPSSSSHFVIGMVIFDRFQDAEDAANIVKNLRKDMGLKREFRFSSSNVRVRDAFFDAILKANFSIRILVVEKKLIHSRFLKKNDEKFVAFCLKNLMNDANSRVKNAIIKIDGKGSKAFKHASKTYLRKELPSGVIKDLKFCDSKKDVLVQIADMMVSAFSRPYNSPNRKDAFKWRNLIESKIENIWKFK